jgi:hypothetical protein
MNLVLKAEKYSLSQNLGKNQLFQSWQRNTRDNHEFGPQNQTPEEFKKSARYQTLKSIIRNIFDKNEKQSSLKIQHGDI